MPSALTSPWSDTGTTASFTISGSVELNASGHGCAIRLGLRGAIGTGLNWILKELYSFNGTDWISDLQLTEPLGDNIGGFPPFPTVIASINHGPTPPPANTFFAPVAFSSTLGPGRLGARFDIPVGAPVDAPQGLADENSLVLAWFESEASQFNETVGGVNETVYSLASLGAPGTDCSRIISGPVAVFTCSGGPSAPGVGIPIAKFTAVTLDGALLDTDGIDLAPITSASFAAVALGAFNITDLTTVGSELRAAPGGSVTFNNSAVDYSGAAASPDLVDNWLTIVDLFRGSPKTPQQTFLSNATFTAPFYTNYPRATKNPPGFIALGISPAWLAANGHDPQDLTVVLDQHSPISAALVYTPVTISQQSAIEIDRPSGGRPSHWAINSGANGSVAENAGDTTFVVTNPAAVFHRAYQTNWRNYITNPTGAEFAADGYSFLERHFGIDVRMVPQTVYPEDYWWWNTFMFLRLHINASAPAVLTLTVRGIDLGIGDSHASNPTTRASELSFAYNHETRIYQVALAAGTFDYWLDLSFPEAYISESGAPFPMRRPRVESLDLSFSAAGTFIVDAWELSRRDAYPTQVKVSYSPQSSYNGEWPAVYLRVDGEATPILTYGDGVQKGQEQEPAFGGSVRFAEPEAGSVMAARNMWAQLARLEGFTVVYADASRASFHDDAYGVSVVSQAGEPAQFAKEIAPGANFVGAGPGHAYAPEFCIRCGKLSFPNGLTVTVRGRHVFGGGVEAVAMVGGGRAGAGLVFNVLDQANVLLGTATTDARGRLHFEPIGFGKVVRFAP